MSDEEVIIFESDDEGDYIDTPVETTQYIAQPTKQNVDNTNYSQFSCKTAAERRLLMDFKNIQKSNPKDLGFRAFPYNNSLMNWEVRLFGFDPKDPVFNDMKQYSKSSGKDYIEMRVSFPPDYPNAPPFVRVVQPRFQFHTGRVTIGGSLCTDVLTMAGWKAVYDIESLLTNIISEILASKPRIDLANTRPYSLEEAKSAYQRVAADHGWKVSGWLPQ